MLLSGILAPPNRSDKSRLRQRHEPARLFCQFTFPNSQAISSDAYRLNFDRKRRDGSEGRTQHVVCRNPLLFSSLIPSRDAIELAQKRKERKNRFGRIVSSSNRWEVEFVTSRVVSGNWKEYILLKFTQF